MDEENNIQLRLHEMPILRAWWMMLRCRLKGGHAPFYTGRTFLGWTPEREKHYMLHYICEHCNKDLSCYEFER